jgi:integrase
VTSRRRGNGEGSIYQRRDGVWCASLRILGGGRKIVYGRTHNEVRRRLTEMVHSKDSGTLSDARGVTVGEFLDQWMADVVQPSVRPWTYKGYEVHVRVHIKPALGRVPLDALSPRHVQALLNQKLAEGLSPKTVRYIRGTFRTALRQATRWGLIGRNPVDAVDGPKVERFEIRPFTPDEARQFLTAIRSDRLEALYSVALTMGLRQGEALGLRWQDVDLAMGSLHIKKQLQRVNGEFQLVEPKTPRSRRTLALPGSIVAALRHHKDHQQDERHKAGHQWQDSDLVFTTDRGRPLDGTVVSHHFHRVLDHAGLPQRRFHDLRHSCATLLLVQGVSARVVMDVLGHSQIALTMNTYTHVIPELRREAADRMEALIADPER